MHRGATSQDIVDTAQVLRIRAESAALQESLTSIMSACAALAREHAGTPMPGRTWLQQASPTTFGLKAAGWLDMIGRCRARLRDAAERSQVLQLGGASGTLASLGDAGPAVADAMAKELGLVVPATPGIRAGSPGRRRVGVWHLQWRVGQDWPRSHHAGAIRSRRSL